MERVERLLIVGCSRRDHNVSDRTFCLRHGAIALGDEIGRFGAVVDQLVVGSGCAGELAGGVERHGDGEDAERAHDGEEFQDDRQVLHQRRSECGRACPGFLRIGDYGRRVMVRLTGMHGNAG
jgi:hypothetical protein